MTAPTLANKSILRRKAKRITTVIIDTAALTSGDLVFDRVVPISGTDNEVLSTAHDALSGRKGPLGNALGEAQDTAPPIAFFSGRTEASVRHYGEQFEAAWIGKPTTIAHQARLTDTEREQFLMMARKLAAHGSAVYAVARSQSHKAPTSYSDVSVEIIGLVLFHPQLHHGTESAVAAIKDNDITVVYASGDTEHTVMNLAGASLVANQSTVPFVYRAGRELPGAAILYASLSDSAHNKVIASFPKQSTLVVNEPLPEFWRDFTTFLR